MTLDDQGDLSRRPPSLLAASHRDKVVTARWVRGDFEGLVLHLALELSE